MARTYEEGNLSPIQLDSPDWALAWVRQYLRDYPNVRTNEPTHGDVWPEFSRSDQAIDALAELDAVKLPDGTVLGYRPHVTAARMYLGDPTLWRTRAVDGNSETRRDPNEVVAAWLNQGRAFDALFPAGTVLPPFEVVDVETSTPGAPEWSPSSIPLIVGGL